MIAARRRDFLRLAGSAVGGAFLSARWIPAARAAASACSRAEPAVRVAVSVPEPVLDNSQPQRAIQALNPGYHGGQTIGLYSAEVAAKIETRFRSFTLARAAPSSCLSITAVDVRIVMPTRRIYVASELSPWTCPHAAVLEHERKHEAADDLAVRKHAPRIQQAIEAAVANAGPLQVSVDGSEAAQARMIRLVQSAFDKAWGAFMTERNERQRQVDAGLEYARVTASCSDWSQLQR